MPNLYQTSRDAKLLEIEDTPRDGFPFRILITLKKLGVVTALDFFITPDEAQGMIKALSGSGNNPG